MVGQKSTKEVQKAIIESGLRTNSQSQGLINYTDRYGNVIYGYTPSGYRGGKADNPEREAEIIAEAKSKLAALKSDETQAEKTAAAIREQKANASLRAIEIQREKEAVTKFRELSKQEQQNVLREASDISKYESLRAKKPNAVFTDKFKAIGERISQRAAQGTQTVKTEYQNVKQAVTENSVSVEEKKASASSYYDRLRSFNFSKSDFISRSTTGERKGMFSLPGTIAKTGLTGISTIVALTRLDKIDPFKNKSWGYINRGTAESRGAEIVLFAGFSQTMTTRGQYIRALSNQASTVNIASAQETIGKTSESVGRTSESFGRFTVKSGGKESVQGTLLTASKSAAKNNIVLSKTFTGTSELYTKSGVNLAGKETLKKVLPGISANEKSASIGIGNKFVQFAYGKATMGKSTTPFLSVIKGEQVGKMVYYTGKAYSSKGSADVIGNIVTRNIATPTYKFTAFPVSKAAQTTLTPTIKLLPSFRGEIVSGVGGVASKFATSTPTILQKSYVLTPLLKPRESVITKDILPTKLSVNLYNPPRERDRTNTDTILKFGDSTNNRGRTITTTTQESIQTLRPISIPVPVSETRGRNPRSPSIPILPPRTTTDILIPVGWRTRPAKETRTQNLFSVGVRRTGKFKTIGSNLGLQRAITIGSTKVKKTPLTEFKLTPQNMITPGIRTPKGFKRKKGLVFIETGGIKI